MAEIRGSLHQYLDYYFNATESLQKNLEKLLKKYNGKTILSFLGANAFPNEYTHLALFHNIGERDLFPCIDNDGGIYPWDQEIGQISKDPQFWDSSENFEKMELREKYHSIIFLCWLSFNWIDIQGYNYNIVVKTLENNSTQAFYLNDFEFNSESKFHLNKNWKEAVEKYNVRAIELDKLYFRIKNKYDR
jgi:hypothetical protein